MKTVLITGCSSGYGLETARYFLSKNWNVIATMRTPNPELLPSSEHLRILPLDITNPESIRALIQTIGLIDVLVNNAGIGVVGAFEATSMDIIKEVFETNTFGTMAMMQAVMPQFRERNSGVIVNVTSSVTLAAMPLAAAYTASKTAITGLTESIAFELASFNIRVKLVEPGYAPTTRFAENGGARMQDLIPEQYMTFAEPIFAAFAHPKAITKEIDVAEAIWQAVNDASNQLHYAAGADAVALTQMHKIE
ncbi:hypothetical protein F908_02216 [Acinetobacter sp. NIPH 284]|uniref:SDR family oxidoreductase n=1 Tax=Acinetobacter sp. NIPH 284 TaxID=1217704 RepID=UPI0002D0D555|nr:SDR family oxidoreductase [Acinetobacter sp. NIPH 284]ENW80019.1 hypothetical protein F908_02216 [Acinetobacter sp. NIPH 284]